MVFKDAHFLLDLGAPGCYMGPLTHLDLIDY